MKNLTIASFALAFSLLVLPGCKGGKQGSSTEAPKMPWEDPAYKTDIRATMAESRPGPDEKGWTEWMKHHENRKRWCAEKQVDLLMVGDSIVFEWPRVGRQVWERFYGNRNAVNIGSSGDQTQHMLWHFQNGGLDGMKNRNPKLVLIMIGTNNRGEPEKHGEDTAYGILALLKEIHSKLPESKILLLPIFPRGDTPEDPNRIRNEEINKIIQSYVDNKTVHWLDIGHVFLDENGKLNRELMPDGLHPNLEGYRVWARAMEPTIANFLGEPSEALPKEAVKTPAKILEKNQMPIPDFTQGDSIPKGAENDWALGATGARGWIYFHKLLTTDARQISITAVAEASPASGILKVGDVILGVAGKDFSYDAREEFGRALTGAEASDGKLNLTRWRDGNTEEVTVELPVLGSYSPTAPYDCPKSKLILEKASEALAKRMQEPDYAKTQNAISRSLNALGLLATGDPKYNSILKKEAEWAAAFTTDGYAVWWYGYVSVFLGEYALATGDKSVLPGLRRIALEAANGQSKVGSWGHRFAGPDGRLFGYGMMNSPGIPMTIGLVLAKEAGVNDHEVATAIERSVKLLRFYIGKGSVPYGDHDPYMAVHEDNGKCGMSAVLFDLLGNEEGTRFFAKMSTAAYGYERDAGHTGNFFNITWAMPGVARGGPHATGAWMEEFGAWYFDFNRNPDWSFPYPGPPKERLVAHKDWDMSGVLVMTYAMPNKAIRLTGKKPSATAPLSPEVARSVVRDGHEINASDAFDRLSSWSPIVRDRAATVLAGDKDLPIERYIELLDAPSVEARLGACQALARIGSRGAPAVPKLRETLKADDLWLRVQAATALAVIGEPAMAAAPELLQIVAKGASAEDPRGMEQRYITQALFNSRTGMLGNSLKGVDRAELLEAVRAGLRNEDGRTRGSISSVYSNLSLEELRPILPSIHEAILEKSPSGIMFDGQIQTAGLDLFSRHHVSEGIELLADYVRTQKKHGSDNHTAKLLAMLKLYGAHAQRAIPLLEKAAYYFENDEEDFPKSLSLKKAGEVREAIKEIKGMTKKPTLIELNL